MHLYNLTLSPPTSISCAVVGQFSGTRQQEVVVCRAGSRLELMRLDTQTGHTLVVMEQHTFGVIRSLSSFRLLGGTKDYLIIGSDSGRITIAEYQPKTNNFVVVHQETFGRSGSRRIVPGQYLATDPKGRAVMIGAMEKAKLVYILNRDSAANLTISSPLEAHKPHGIIHAVVGVDVGYENPLFACLEVDYEEADRDPTGEAAKRTEKLLTYYELDLGLNHVVRRWSAPVDPRANHLVQVPGGYNQSSERWEGPSGVLVCSEDYISYRHSVGDEHRLPIPRRLNPVEREEARRGTIIVASVCHRMKTGFFFLLQSEDGDLFKLTIDHDGEDMNSMSLKYFDTVPVASSLCILRAGFLFVGSEFGAGRVYSFQKLGDDDDLPEYRSADLPAFGATGKPLEAPRFTPRPLENLVLTDELVSSDPLLDARLLPGAAAGESPNVYAACGRGPRSSFKSMQHGLEVQEAVSSDLPGIPNAVWTTRMRADDTYDRYIILSFVNGTLVLSIGEMLEEVNDSGFLTSAPTLAVQQLGEDGIIQVHPSGLRHILSDKRVTEWITPPAPDGSETQVVAAATNERQVVLALAPTNELVYFELDMDGQLNEYQERKGMGSRVITLSVANVPEGRQRTPYLAAGCEDQTVRIISLDPDSTLASISIQALTAPPHSICVAEMQDMTVDRNRPTLFVNIGLVNGVLHRTVLDPVSGQLTDTRTRFLGAKPVRLVRVRMEAKYNAVLALSSRPWLSYTHRAHTHFDPLLFDALDHAWSFSAEMCPEGLIGIVSGSLRIFTIPTLGLKLHSRSVPLSHTPRRIAHHPSRPGLVYIVESDHRTLSTSEQARRVAQLPREPKVGQRGVLDLPPEEFGPVRAEAGQWSSCIRIVDAVTMQTVSCVELENNEAAFCVALVPFPNSSLAAETAAVAAADSQHNGGVQNGDSHRDPFLVVGSAMDANVSPRKARVSYLSVYRLRDHGRAIELLHRTEVEDVPLVVRSFQGRLLAGVGRVVRIYELGKKKLLRKCENKTLPTAVTSLHSQGSRVVAGDVQESVFFGTFKPAENRLIFFADDTVPRWTTAVTMLDVNTVAAADKFGNVWVSRLDAAVARQVDEDPTGVTLLHEKPSLHGCAHKTALQAHFYVGDTVTSLQRANLVPGGREVLIYACLGGTVGALVPFVAKEDVETLSRLEMHLRQEAGASLVGRDHLAYRGYYAPVKAVVDGDLCETFGSLPPQRQAAIAEELDRTPAEVNKKLESLRVTSAF